jgi:hypothetical protein
MRGVRLIGLQAIHASSSHCMSNPFLPTFFDVAETSAESPQTVTPLTDTLSTRLYPDS